MNDPDGHTPHLLIGNEATGLWMRNSALDNTKFLSMKIEQLMGYRAQSGGRSDRESEPTRSNSISIREQYLFARVALPVTQSETATRLGRTCSVSPACGIAPGSARIITEPDKMIDGERSDRHSVVQAVQGDADAQTWFSRSRREHADRVHEKTDRQLSWTTEGGNAELSST